MDFLIALIPIACATLIARLLTVSFHELGHALPAILLTREKVSIYIGSYGDSLKSVRFEIGLLEIWFRYNPLSWRKGVCVPSAKEISLNSQIIYTVAGPLTSFLIAIVACYFSFAYDFHGALKLIAVVFCASSVFDLFTNLTPRSTPIKLYDGTIIYNDGHQLMKLFYYKKLPKEYKRAVDLYNEQKFDKSAELFNNLLEAGWTDEYICKPAFAAYWQANDYANCIAVQQKFIELDKMTWEELVNAGICYLRLHQYDKAMALYDKSLELNPDNKYSLNNKAFTLTVIKRYEEAIPLLDRAIEIDNAFAYSYNNRGLAKIKIEKVQEGLEDISHSLKLDSQNAYAYRNLGIYHLDRGENSKALPLFEKAKALDPATFAIDELLTSAKA
jgi:tetratricopeptide (TPR) repeat protein